MSRAAIKYQSYFISLRTNRACARVRACGRSTFGGLIFFLLPPPRLLSPSLSLSRFFPLFLFLVLHLSPSPPPPLSFPIPPLSRFVLLSSRARLVSRNLHMALRVNGARPQ